MVFSNYTLKLVDLASGRECTAQFPGTATARDILNHMGRNLMLRFPPSKCLIREWPREKQTLQELALPQGATLHIEFDTGLEEYLTARDTLKNLYKTYRLNFEHVGHRSPITVVCRGFDKAEDVIERLIRQRYLPQPEPDCSYFISQWNKLDIRTYYNTYGGPGRSHFYSALNTSAYLCDIDPKDGETWWICTHLEDSSPERMVQALYGCPPASSVYQKPELDRCTVDVIEYD